MPVDWPRPKPTKVCSGCRRVCRKSDSAGAWSRVLLAWLRLSREGGVAPRKARKGADHKRSAAHTSLRLGAWASCAYGRHPPCSTAKSFAPACPPRAPSPASPPDGSVSARRFASGCSCAGGSAGCAFCLSHSAFWQHQASWPNSFPLLPMGSLCCFYYLVWSERRGFSEGWRFRRPASGKVWARGFVR